MLDLLTTKAAAAASTLATPLPPVRASGPQVPAAAPAAIVYVQLHKIADNPYQPRGHYGAEHILNLALSIKQLQPELPATHGLQQIPLARVVTLDPSGLRMALMQSMYTEQHAQQALSSPNALVELMFGHRRLRAFMLLAEGLRALRDGSAIGIDLTTVSELESRYAALLDPDPTYRAMPLMLAFALDHQMWAHAVTENSQRRNITAIEEAQTIQRAIDEFGLTTAEAGKPFGYARSTTANKLRLLALPTEIRQAIATGDLSERHARELLRLADDPDRLAKVSAETISKGYSVRQLTTAVNWQAQAMQEAQAKAAEYAAARQALAAGWALPGQTVLVGADRLIVDDRYPNPIDRTNPKEAALIQQGHCGAHCPCFSLRYAPHRHQHGFGPDHQQAPHIVACCSDYTAQRAKLAALPAPKEATPAQGHGRVGYPLGATRVLATPTQVLAASEEIAEKQEEAQRQQQIVDLNNQAHALWQAWLKDQDLQALWNDLRFWQAAAIHSHWLGEAIRLSTSTHDACQEILRLLYKKTRQYDPALQNEVHQPQAVQTLIKSLGGTVSQETPPASTRRGHASTRRVPASTRRGFKSKAVKP